MAPSNSRHLLPMSSVLFNNKDNSSSHLPTSHPANHTLANLQDAQNTTVTALPQPLTTAINAEPAKEGFWKRMLAKLKNALVFEWGKKKEEEGTKEMCIGEPTEFKHIMTSGPNPLLGTIPVAVEEGESEWEDMGESETGRNPV